MWSLGNATKIAPEAAKDTFTGTTHETTQDEFPWDSSHREDALQQTILFFQNEIEELVTMGVEAYHRSEKAARELQTLREELKSKQDELERVREAEEKSRTTVAVRNY
jgi:predicted nucleotide-binding protein (sugar kinase/HSP70/actin superfamily)